MLNRSLRLASATVLMLVLSACGSTNAATSNSSIAHVDILLYHPEMPEVSYSVHCDGDTATVEGTDLIDAATACARLFEDDTRSRLIDGPQYDDCDDVGGGPDEADISGYYDRPDGPAVATFVHRSNSCGIDDWNVLLDGVLPAPNSAGTAVE